MTSAIIGPLDSENISFDNGFLPLSLFTTRLSLFSSTEWKLKVDMCSNIKQWQVSISLSIIQKDIRRQKTGLQCQLPTTVKSVNMFRDALGASLRISIISHLRISDCQVFSQFTWNASSQ
jgi:hypothetical protein